MIPRQPITNQQSLFFSLASSLNPTHALYQLSTAINGRKFESAFEKLYCQDNGRPSKPIRLLVGLLILKYIRNLSDESVVEPWAENLYYQYFCGQTAFIPMRPCEASELVHFRKQNGVQTKVA